MKINHKNGIKNDNRVENLEWCDGKYNSNYTYFLNPDFFRGENHPRVKYTKELILDIYKTAWEGKLTYREIGLKFNIPLNYIEQIKFGKKWSYITKHHKSGNMSYNLTIGERHGMAKLSDKQVLEIYNLAWNSNMRCEDIGKIYNITGTNVCCIKNGKSWSHVTQQKRLDKRENVNCELNPSAKITNLIAIEIYKDAWNSKLSINEVAEKYSVKRSHVCAIKYGRSWNIITNHKKQRNKNDSKKI